MTFLTCLTYFPHIGTGQEDHKAESCSLLIARSYGQRGLGAEYDQLRASIAEHEDEGKGEEEREKEVKGKRAKIAVRDSIQGRRLDRAGGFFKEVSGSRLVE